MRKDYVRVPPTVTLRETLKLMRDRKQNCVLVVDAEDLLEGILTSGDIQRALSKSSTDAPNSDPLVLDVCAFHYYYFR